MCAGIHSQILPKSSLCVLWTTRSTTWLWAFTLLVGCERGRSSHRSCQRLFREQRKPLGSNFRVTAPDARALPREYGTREIPQSNKLVGGHHSLSPLSSSLESQGPKLQQGKPGQDSGGSQEPAIPNVVPLTVLLCQGKSLGCAKAQAGSMPKKPRWRLHAVTAHAKQGSWQHAATGHIQGLRVRCPQGGTQGGTGFLATECLV